MMLSSASPVRQSKRSASPKSESLFVGHPGLSQAPYLLNYQRNEWVDEGRDAVAERLQRMTRQSKRPPGTTFVRRVCGGWFVKITVASQGPDITAAAALDHRPPRFWIVYDTATHTYEVCDSGHIGRRPSEPISCSDSDGSAPASDGTDWLSGHSLREMSGMSVGDVIELVMRPEAVCPV